MAEDVRRRSPQGYQPVPVNPDGRYYAAVLAGFWLQVDWILATEPPACRPWPGS